MSNIDKQWLQQKIAGMEAARDEIPFGLDEDDSNTLAAMRIALASLEAEPGVNHEPVAWQYKEYVYVSGLGYLWREKLDCEFPGADCETLQDVVPLYTAPPAPVSVPAAYEHTEDFSEYHEGWNACRAAMIQGAEPVSNRDEFPLDYLQGHKDGLEWAAQLAEANHPQTGDWLYDDPIDLAKAIRKGPDIPELKPVAADADDNFYSWFCREWEQNYQPNGYSLSAKKHLGAIAESAWFACRGAMLQGANGNSPVIPDGLRLALSNAGIAAPESDEMLAATCEKYIQALVTWVKDRKPFSSAVIPDGWVACSERMPENGEKVLTSFRGGMRTAVCKVVDVLGHKIFVDELTLFNGVPADHWQPLPAAPHFREIVNSSTDNFRENAETSTKCPCCGRRPLKNKTCSVAGCDGKHVARGLCVKHYAIERKKDPSRRESIRAADKRYRARKAAAPQREAK